MFLKKFPLVSALTMLVGFRYLACINLTQAISSGDDGGVGSSSSRTAMPLDRCTTPWWWWRHAIRDKDDPQTMCCFQCTSLKLNAGTATCLRMKKRTVHICTLRKEFTPSVLGSRRSWTTESRHWWRHVHGHCENTTTNCTQGAP